MKPSKKAAVASIRAATAVLQHSITTAVAEGLAQREATLQTRLEAEYAAAQSEGEAMRVLLEQEVVVCSELLQLVETSYGDGGGAEDRRLVCLMAQYESMRRLADDGVTAVDGASGSSSSSSSNSNSSNNNSNSSAMENLRRSLAQYVPPSAGNNNSGMSGGAVLPSSGMIHADVRDGPELAAFYGLLRRHPPLGNIRVRVQLIGHARNNMYVNISHAWL